MPFYYHRLLFSVTIVLAALSEAHNNRSSSRKLTKQLSMDVLEEPRETPTATPEYKQCAFESELINLRGSMQEHSPFFVPTAENDVAHHEPQELQIRPVEAGATLLGNSYVFDLLEEGCAVPQQRGTFTWVFSYEWVEYNPNVEFQITMARPYTPQELAARSSSGTKRPQSKDTGTSRGKTLSMAKKPPAPPTASKSTKRFHQEIFLIYDRKPKKTSRSVHRLVGERYKHILSLRVCFTSTISGLKSGHISRLSLKLFAGTLHISDEVLFEPLVAETRGDLDEEADEESTLPRAIDDKMSRMASFTSTRSSMDDDSHMASNGPTMRCSLVQGGSVVSSKRSLSASSPMLPTPHSSSHLTDDAEASALGSDSTLPYPDTGPAMHPITAWNLLGSNTPSFESDGTGALMLPERRIHMQGSSFDSDASGVSVFPSFTAHSSSDELWILPPPNRERGRQTFWKEVQWSLQRSKRSFHATEAVIEIESQLFTKWYLLVCIYVQPSNLKMKAYVSCVWITEPHTLKRRAMSYSLDTTHPVKRVSVVTVLWRRTRRHEGAQSSLSIQNITLHGFTVHTQPIDRSSRPGSASSLRRRESLFPMNPIAQGELMQTRNPSPVRLLHSDSSSSSNRSPSPLSSPYLPGGSTAAPYRMRTRRRSSGSTEGSYGTTGTDSASEHSLEEARTNFERGNRTHDEKFKAKHKRWIRRNRVRLVATRPVPLKILNEDCEGCADCESERPILKERWSIPHEERVFEFDTNRRHSLRGTLLRDQSESFEDDCGELHSFRGTDRNRLIRESSFQKSTLPRAFENDEGGTMFNLTTFQDLVENPIHQPALQRQDATGKDPVSDSNKSVVLEADNTRTLNHEREGNKKTNEVENSGNENDIENESRQGVSMTSRILVVVVAVLVIIIFFLFSRGFYRCILVPWHRARHERSRRAPVPLRLSEPEHLDYDFEFEPPSSAFEREEEEEGLLYDLPGYCIPLAARDTYKHEVQNSEPPRSNSKIESSHPGLEDEHIEDQVLDLLSDSVPTKTKKKVHTGQYHTLRTGKKS